MALIVHGRRFFFLLVSYRPLANNLAAAISSKGAPLPHPQA